MKPSRRSSSYPRADRPPDSPGTPLHPSRIRVLPPRLHEWQAQSAKKGRELPGLAPEKFTERRPKLSIGVTKPTNLVSGANWCPMRSGPGSMASTRTLTSGRKTAMQIAIPGPSPRKKITKNWNRVRNQGTPPGYYRGETPGRRRARDLHSPSRAGAADRPAEKKVTLSEAGFPAAYSSQ